VGQKGVKWFLRVPSGGVLLGLVGGMFRVAGFVGSFEHSLDVKGRVILPVRFREPFLRGGYLTPSQGGCLALWTPGEFERQTEQMLQMSRESSAGRDLARMWAATAADVEVDRQGRMPIPARLRDLAQLDGEVLIQGAIDRIEIWAPSMWAERIQPSEQWFLGDDV